jgi:flagellin-like protein
MNFSRKKAVSPIIATLLLIAMAVAAGIVTYVFVISLSGSLTSGGGTQVSERLQMQSFNFLISPGTCACAQQIIELFLLNSGSSSTTISAIYYDGTPLLVSTPFTAAMALSGLNNNVYTAPTTTTLADFTTTCSSVAGPAGSFCFTAVTTKTAYNAQDVGQIVITFSAAVTAGTSHTVKVVSATGAAFVFPISAGKTG